MADSRILQKFILSWEGGFANHPLDPGGATMKGVTLATFRQVLGANKSVEELKRITDEQWHTIFKRYYWDRWRADEIKSQSIANILVDFVWASGKYGITKIQQLLGVTVDGIVCDKTLSALNGREPKQLFNDIYAVRKKFIEGLKTYPTFGKGWMRRLNSMGYGWLVLNSNPSRTLTWKERSYEDF